MSSSSVSGPYASAVSIRFAPSSTARRNTFNAFARSGGQPQIPSPVRRIAPNPSRLTDKSPPILKVELSLGDAAPKTVVALPAKSVAPVARVARRNNRRVITSQTRSRFVPKGSSLIADNVSSHGIFSRSNFERSSTRPDYNRFGGVTLSGYSRGVPPNATHQQRVLPRIHPFASVQSAV